jgi:hypothetical protein
MRREDHGRPILNLDHCLFKRSGSEEGKIHSEQEKVHIDFEKLVEN